MTRVNVGGLPGIDAALRSEDRQVWWGIREQQIFEGGIVAAATVDAGNTPTTQLRAGLVLGMITASSKWTQYSATATDGSEVPGAVLEFGLPMLDAGGTAVDKSVMLLMGGRLKASMLPNLDLNARAILGRGGKFLFDDDLLQKPVFGSGFWTRQKVVTDAASPYAVPVTENGTLYLTTGAGGAVTFNLPAHQNGLCYGFLNMVDQNMLVTAPAAILIGLNSITGTTVSFQTANQKRGGMFIAEALINGKWMIHQWSSAGHTATIA